MGQEGGKGMIVKIVNENIVPDDYCDAEEVL